MKKTLMYLKLLQTLIAIIHVLISNDLNQNRSRGNITLFRQSKQISNDWGEKLLV